MHELCYAVSKNPLEGFTYGGVIVSNCDIGITNGKPAEKPVAYGANNHGSIIDIMDQWYIFITGIQIIPGIAGRDAQNRSYFRENVSVRQR